MPPTHTPTTAVRRGLIYRGINIQTRLASRRNILNFPIFVLPKAAQRQTLFTVLTDGGDVTLLLFKQRKPFDISIICPCIADPHYRYHKRVSTGIAVIGRRGAFWRRTRYVTVVLTQFAFSTFVHCPT